ncbi:MAG: ROK family protein [Clostridia bacterium]|nr:ROK family protein [Clostridia bacterium]
MYRVGVDLGGTNIAVGVVDDNFNIIGRGKMKTNAPRDAKLIFDDIATAVKMAVEDANLRLFDIESIGIGTPGSVNKELGMIDYANNLAFDHVPAKALLSASLGIDKIYIDNDANCAALGEALAGAGKDKNSFVAITLGTGVGSGIVIDGKLVNGCNYAAGEFGHMVIAMDGEQCNCGRRGCWERYASATALIAQTKDAMKKDVDSIMWELVDNNIARVSGRTAFDAMRKGDATGKMVVDNYIRYIAVGLVNVINALQPDVICIGGGISHEKDNLLVPLRKHVSRGRYSIYSDNQTELCCAVLGNDAGIIGAALLDK